MSRMWFPHGKFDSESLKEVTSEIGVLCEIALIAGHLGSTRGGCRPFHFPIFAS